MACTARTFSNVPARLASALGNPASAVYVGCPLIVNCEPRIPTTVDCAWAGHPQANPVANAARAGHACNRMTQLYNIAARTSPPPGHPGACDVPIPPASRGACHAVPEPGRLEHQLQAELQLPPRRRR